MNERNGLVTMKGNPITLLGNEVKVGDSAPDIVLLDNGLNPVRLSSYRGKTVIISVVPSLDTPVCDMQTRRFNTEAGKLGENVVVLTVSMDLPFAQKRWCGAVGVDHVSTLSDHATAQFGEQFGVLIKDLRLLARSIFILDKEGMVRYQQLVKEVADEPDYEAVLDTVKNLV